MIRRLLPFIVAGILGLAAVVLMQQYLQGQRRAIQAEWKKLRAQYQLLNPSDVLVAKIDIAPETKVQPEHLEKRTIPAQYHAPYSTASPSDVVGLVARVPLAQGEQILTNKLRRPEEVAPVDTLSAATPKGMRAITVGMDVLTGVGGFVRPGDKVDLLWLFQPPAEGRQVQDLVTMTLFQNVDVLAVGADMVGKPSASQEAGRDYTVTLSLTPQQAAVLLYAREQGRVQLSLRSKAEATGDVPVQPADMNMLMETITGERFMPPPPPRQHSIEVIRGLEHTVVAVEE